MGKGERPFLPVWRALHLAMPFEDTPFIDNQGGGEEVPMKLACGVNLSFFVNMDLPFHLATDDDGVDPDLSFDDGGLCNDECSAIKDLPFEFTFQAEYTLKGHLSFKEAFLSQEGTDLLMCGRGL